jgi:imidazole glycerol-phosphate synthase subunit HisH
MNIAIIDYNMGNPGSILNMLKYLGIEGVITDNPKEIALAKKIILPGVGAFDNGITNLTSSGLYDVLEEKVVVDKVPVLGICLGMQLMTLGSEEGILNGFGWINAHTRRFISDKTNNIKVPHIGWNKVNAMNGHPITHQLDEQSKFYFVHSYHVVCNHRKDAVATTGYGITFDSMFARENIYGCQFHPEKSHKYGMRIFKNFNQL